jgi:hypothetical protein
MYTISMLVSCTVLISSLTVCGDQRRFLNRTIKGNTTLTPEWIEITLDKPLKPSRDIQVVMLYLDEPYVGDFESNAVRLPDGTLVQPEVQFVDTAGKTYPLKPYGFFGRKLIMFTLKDQLMGRDYRAVRVRSDKPIQCKEIIWRCFYWREID